MSDEANQGLPPPDAFLDTQAADLAGTIPVELDRGDTVGRYVVLARVGAGGMGVVYAAYDPELDRKIALKLIRADPSGSVDSAARSSRLLREAQAMARLSHPNVITVHDVGIFEGQVFVAMEFVDGPTLTRWLREKRRTWREVVQVFRRAGRGIAAAHAAGLVHRDLKPDNILFGSDGRVRVADFGLARPVGAVAEFTRSEGELPSGRALLAEPMTLDGSVMGTPGFMAPEQHLGQLADAASDQFSFCAALYYALYGELPFGGSTVDELRAEVLRGRIKDPPKGTRVPAWVRRIIVRGLSTDPRLRFPSLDVLLAELSRDPRLLRRRWLTAGGGAVLVALAAVGYAQFRTHQDLLCKGAEAKLAGVWDDRRKEEIRAAFLATGRPFAQDAWSGTVSVLDRYARAWAAMHTEACEATRLRGEQSEALLDLRMQCLGRRLDVMRSLIGLFARPDGGIVENAVKAALALTGLTGCADVAALSARLPPADDPSVRARIAAARADLARVKVLKDAGKYTEGLALARTAADTARALRYRPLEAESLYQLGVLQANVGELKGAAATLHEAVLAAGAGHHDRVAARAWSRLVFVTGYRQAQPERGRLWARHGAAAIERVGGDPVLEADLVTQLGNLAFREGRNREALASYERALALRQRALGDDHPHTGRSHSNLGVVSRRLGKYEEALAHQQRALAIAERALGPNHPNLAITLNNLGVVYQQLGRYPEALASLRRALALNEGAFGENHPEVAAAASNLGMTLSARGDYAEALGLHQRALAIRETVLGTEHPDVAISLINIGEALVGLGKPAAALPHLGRALEISEKSQGARSPTLANTLETLGEALLALGRNEEALIRFERAVAVQEAAFGLRHPDLAEALTGLGEAQLALGDSARALEALERALALRESTRRDPLRLAKTGFALARALVRAGRDPNRAHQLAARAREIYAGAAGRHGREMSAIQSWLARHGKSPPAPRDPPE